MVPLARRNLLAERGRLIVSVGGVAFAVLLVLVVVSLYRGWGDVGRVYTRLPGGVWVSEEGTLDPYHSSSFLPAASAATLRAVPGVRAAIPVYVRHVAFEANGREVDVLAMALDAPPALAARGDDAGAFPPRGAITIDRVLADRAGVGVGDTLDVLGLPLRVHRVERGGTEIFQAAFLSAADARELIAQPGLVSFVVLELVPGADPVRVAADARAAVPGTATHTTEQFAESFGERVSEGFLEVVGVLVAIGLLVGGAVVALTTYTATIERSQEYGVLKAMGASTGFLYRIVVAQSLSVGLAGALLGAAAAAALARWIPERVPEFVTDMRVGDVALVLAGALVMSALAGWVPARRIDRIDPAEVFRA